MTTGSTVDNYFTWFHVGGLTVPVGILVDPLSITMCLFVTGVSALIHLYSIGYMKGDPDYPKFFLYLNLFVFSMLLLVLANNLLLTFVGWEGVGVCSYWLVAFWFHRDSAASAGKKAFIYNRIGDVGFLVAMFLIFEKTGTLQYTGGPGGGIFGQLGHLGGGTRHRGGAAPVPRRDGQVGPDPAVQLAARRHGGPDPGVGADPRRHHGDGRRLPALPHEPRAGAHRTPATEVIAIIGGVTAFVAATIACAQQDIKKVLAFSTVSQIGYMVLAVGVGRLHRRDLLDGRPRLLQGAALPGRRLGHPRARRRAGPQAHGRPAQVPCSGPPSRSPWAGWPSPASRPSPASGRKGDVLANVYAHYKPLWVLGVLTAVLTAYYMTRLQVLAFGGEPRWDKIGPDGEPAHHAPHESPWVMRLPLVVLAVAHRSSAACSTCRGSTTTPWPGWLAPVFAGSLLQRPPPRRRPVGARPDRRRRRRSSASSWPVVLWRGAQVEKPQLEPQFLQRVWYWDDFYDAVIGRPSQKLATFCRLGGRRPRSSMARSTARPASCVRRGSRDPQAADGVRAQLRPGHRRGYGRPHRLPPQPDVVVDEPQRPLPHPADPPAGGGQPRPGAARPGSRLPKAAGRCRWRSGSRSPPLVIAVIAFITMTVHFGGYQLVSNHAYTGETLGIRWYMGIDGISVFLVLLTARAVPARAHHGPGQAQAAAPTRRGCSCSRRRSWAASSPWT